MANIGPQEVSHSTLVHSKPIRWGDTVFFKVEEVVFEVPRHGFVAASKVFKDMFLLPSINGQEEGQDEDHPIVLDSYRSIEFNALIKVLYPAPHDVISGSYTLSREEWVGVLNLSTRWEMKEIRKHAIQQLTKLMLKMSAVEKVALARQCKVSQWFQEGLKELAADVSVGSLAELKSQLGLETACTLLYVKSQSQGPPQGHGLLFNLRSMRCASCKATMFAKGVNCSNCQHEIRIDDCGDIYIATGGSIVGLVTTTDGITGPALMEPYVSQNHFRCRRCYSCPFKTALVCPSCSYTTANPNLYFGLTRPQSNNSDGMILEEFKDEIALYESLDED